MNSNLLELITSNYATFSKSDKKVADVILNNPHQAISSSIAYLAILTYVSEPSVHRFCQKLQT